MKYFKALIFSTFFFTYLFSWTEVVSANDLGLIEIQTLFQNISKWTILDARPKSQWITGHIPGALSFSWEDYARTDEHGIPYRVWKPQELAKALGKMGIDEKKPIIVYGDADKSWGGEGWTCWVLSWLGHRGPIRMLNGGIQSWKNYKYPLTSGEEITKNKAVQYSFKINPYIDISTSDIENQKTNSVLVDTRSSLEWFKGKIPGAIHVSWDDFFSGKERRPLHPDDLKKLLKKKGVDTNKTVIYYCSDGIRSGYAWLVHHLSGLPEARNYEGGYEEWKRLTLK